MCSAKDSLFSKAQIAKIDSRIANIGQSEKLFDKMKRTHAESSLEKLIGVEDAISKLQVNSPFNKGQISRLRKLHNPQIGYLDDSFGDPRQIRPIEISRWIDFANIYSFSCSKA